MKKSTLVFSEAAAAAIMAALVSMGALRHSTATQKGILDSGFTGLFATTGRLLVYTGAQPATADTAPSGTLLATLSMSSTAFAASNTPAAASTAGTTSTANAISSATAGNSGTAGWVRLQLSGDAGSLNNTDKRLDFLIGTDITIDNAAIVSGGTVACTSLVYTHPYQ